MEGLNQTGIDKSNTKVDNPYHLFPLNWRSIKGFIRNRKPCIIHSEIYLHPFFIVKTKNILNQWYSSSINKLYIDLYMYAVITIEAEIFA